jgi:hypothetical protein
MKRDKAHIGPVVIHAQPDEEKYAYQCYAVVYRGPRIAANAARELRNQGHNANVYQKRFVIVGPTKEQPDLAHPGRTGVVYQERTLEEVIEALRKGLKLPKKVFDLDHLADNGPPNETIQQALNLTRKVKGPPAQGPPSVKLPHSKSRTESDPPEGPEGQ